MRIILAATMAASVLALGLNPAQSLPLGATITGADAAIEKAQQKEMSPSPGPGMGSQGGQGQGSRAQGRGGPAAVGPGEGGGGRMRGEGRQFRSGERGGYGYGPRSGERGERLGERGERGRVWIGREQDRGHMRRHYGQRGWYGGPAYGFRADCGWLRRRALDTGSRYWWRRYRDCIH